MSAHKGIKHRRQRGGAIVIVLVLVSVLGFVIASVLDLVQRSTLQAAGQKRFSEVHWSLIGLEALGAGAINQTLNTLQGRAMAADNPLFAQIYELPLDIGVARVAMADGSACININSITTGKQGRSELAKMSKEELLRLANNIGIGGGDVERLLTAAADWVDSDDFQEPGGAEDGFYTILPTPYRTGGQLMSDVSELRAIFGGNRELIRVLLPYLCTRPYDAPSPININLLKAVHAPLLAAILGENFSVAQARDIIADIPPGGYRDMTQFWESRKMVGLNNLELLQNRLKGRLEVTSQFFVVTGYISQGDISVNFELTYLVMDDVARVISRRIGRRS